ncbi:MAG: type II toxin-antitoxin system RelE/ParE family toxin [Candidatus Riflebacteria bacterium]|nr:type II toxin-antitoxin system RelE/ParE family toxin [Candidatus Riflebacteria bacterium]
MTVSKEFLHFSRKQQRSKAYFSTSVFTKCHKTTGCHSYAVNAVDSLDSLKNDRNGQHSIRINDQFRVCFVWTDDGAQDVEIVDYH